MISAEQKTRNAYGGGGMAEWPPEMTPALEKELTEEYGERAVQFMKDNPLYYKDVMDARIRRAEFLAKGKTIADYMVAEYARRKRYGLTDWELSEKIREHRKRVSPEQEAMTQRAENQRMATEIITGTFGVMGCLFGAVVLGMVGIFVGAIGGALVGGGIAAMAFPRNRD